MKLSLLTGVLLGTTAFHAQAQQLPDRAQIELATARRIAVEMKRMHVARLGMDTARFERTAESGGLTHQQLATELANARMGSRSMFLSCANEHEPPSCRFLGVDAVVAVGSADVRGDKGYIRVAIDRRGPSARVPVTHTVETYRFVRHDGKWTYDGLASASTT